MKSIKFIFIFVLSLCFNFNVQAFSNEFDKKVDIQVDGKILEFSENPKILEGMLFLPFRELMDSIDISLEWNDSEKKVSWCKDGRRFSFVVGKSIIEVDDEIVYTDVPIKIINNRNFIPISLIERIFEAEIIINNTSNKIEINFASESEDKLYDIKDFDGTVLVHSEIDIEESLPAMTDFDGTFSKSSKADLPREFFERKQERAKRILESHIMSAKSFLSNKIENMGYSSIFELKNEARKFRKSNAAAFKPYECRILYSAQIFDNFVSITERFSLNKGKGDVVNNIISNVYEIDSAEKVNFNNVSMKLFGEKEDYVLKFVKRLFGDKVKENPKSFFENSEDIIKNFNSENFYFSENSLNFYFNSGEIAPSDEGIIEVFLPVKLLFYAM